MDKRVGVVTNGLGEATALVLSLIGRFVVDGVDSDHMHPLTK